MTDDVVFPMRCATCPATAKLLGPVSLLTSGWVARPETHDWLCPSCAAVATEWTARDDARLSLLLKGDSASLPPPAADPTISKLLSLIEGHPWDVGLLRLWMLRPAEFQQAAPHSADHERARWRNRSHRRRDAVVASLTQRDELGRPVLNPFQFGTLILSKRSETDYVILDGVSRWTALCQVTDDPVNEVAPCFWVEDLSRKQEVEIFMAINSRTMRE